MAAQPIYQFYAELSDYNLKIWRRFQVMNNITMARLGYIVMTIFEMQASHLFCFDVPVAENLRKCVREYIENGVNGKAIDLFKEKPDLARLRIEIPSEDDFSGLEGLVLDASETKVKHILTEETETMTFSYDFGGGWEIHLLLEKNFEDKILPGKELPRVLEGEGYGIIEDWAVPAGWRISQSPLIRKKAPNISSTANGSA